MAYVFFIQIVTFCSVKGTDMEAAALRSSYPEGIELSEQTPFPLYENQADGTPPSFVVAPVHGAVYSGLSKGSHADLSAGGPPRL